MVTDEITDMTRARLSGYMAVALATAEGAPRLRRPKGATPNRYLPHQGQREMRRRLRGRDKLGNRP